MSKGFAYQTPATTARPAVELDVAHAEGVAEATRPSGPAAAVVVAAGAGSFTLGVLSVLTAGSDAISDALTLSERVGDISGVTTAATLVFFATWAVLAIAWRRANPRLLRVAAATAVLVALGLLGTFPPFFNAVAG